MHDIEELGKEVVDIAYQIHMRLGPGFKEGVYEECFAYMLQKRNIEYEQQKILQIKFDDIILKTHHKLDLIIDNRIVVELKCVEKLAQIHEAQILSYLRLSQCKLGYLINFNVPLIKQGIKRMIL